LIQIWKKCAQLISHQMIEKPGTSLSNLGEIRVFFNSDSS
jgi:hypothetical protein